MSAIVLAFLAVATVPRVEIEADLTALLAEKHRPDATLREATLRIDDADPIEGELRPRGRKRRWACRVPPFALVLRAPAPALLDSARLHLVTHCDPPDRALGARQLDDRMVREFLAYQYFRTLSDAALDARLVRVEWRDTGARRLRLTHLAIVVEDFDHLAARADLARAPDTDEAAPADEALARFNAFQLFVGNRDFDLRAGVRRNVMLLRDAGGDVPVPYDFDLARTTWGARFGPGTWLRAEICRPSFWRARSRFPADPAVQRAALVRLGDRFERFEALVDAYAPLLTPASAASLREHLAAFRVLLGRRFGVDRVLRTCFGLAG